ncbi:MAG: adenine deaminase [Bacteroidota bacterium]
MPHIEGQLVDLFSRSIYPARVQFENGIITQIQTLDKAPDQYLLPGFVDAHVHIESSMLVPSEFARLAVIHGSVGTVSDPHEIANVLGEKGVHFMIENGRQVPFKFNFGAPSCVPATTFESAGSVIDADGVRALLELDEVRYLAEMMNYPGVLFNDPEVMAKLQHAKDLGKVIDGHAPGLRGEKAQQYIDAGISTDHECFTFEEGLDKIQRGMKIIIREGSAAKNFDALIPLIKDYPDQILFCSDDKHPDDLLVGHMDQIVRRALAAGYDLFDVLRAACVHPLAHYGLNIGLLRKHDPADFIIVDRLSSMQVLATYIDGQLVAQNGKSLIESVAIECLNQFNTDEKQATDFKIPAKEGKLQVIETYDGALITGKLTLPPKIESGFAVSDPSRDLLKIAVVNRYQNSEPACAFIRNVGLKSGAIASCVGHDSHNIIVVGVDDESIARAVNLIIQSKGGISVVGPDFEQALPLPVAGIMSDKDGEQVGQAYSEIDQLARSLGTQLKAPFMTLSFMALLVIPSLKLSDKGLFDGEAFAFTDLWV